MEKDLKKNIDKMLDVVYGPTGTHAETIASVSAVFAHINEVGRNINREERQQGTGAHMIVPCT